MTRSRLRIAIALLAAILALPGASCGRGKMCEVCRRAECGNLTFTIGLEGGKTVSTCCPRCGLHYIEHEHAAVASLSVRDFDTAGALEAKSAFYVEGSDVTPCNSMHGSSAPVDERGCCMKQVYDRCLPSVLAFRSKDRAEIFAREHGGIVRTLSDIEAGRRS